MGAIWSELQDTDGMQQSILNHADSLLDAFAKPKKVKKKKSKKSKDGDTADGNNEEAKVAAPVEKPKPKKPKKKKKKTAEIVPKDRLQRLGMPLAKIRIKYTTFV